MISTAYLRVYVDADGCEAMPRAEDVPGGDPVLARELALLLGRAGGAEDLLYVE